jgi:poly-gamma-glutamate synthesis protein (capsule biosynthesis protein)
MTRREFLARAGGFGLVAMSGLGRSGVAPRVKRSSVKLFLCGDVMTGRGIDQVLPSPGDPTLHEPYVRNAKRYVELAEELNGRIPRPVELSWIWGDALATMERQRPDLRIVNLETAVTRSDQFWQGKGIHYRMHPANSGCLSAAGIDCCVLANNHVLDWGHEGLIETLTSLRQAGIATAGAGRSREEAEAPAILGVPSGRRVLVFAYGSRTSGIPHDWAAAEGRPGVSLLPDLSEDAARRIAQRIAAVKRPGDLVVASIHWGANWGYEIPAPRRRFARWLIEKGAVDVVHGHSSHHPLGLEIHRDRPILYGCGDFLNDYEGIGGHEEFRGDLAVSYFATFAPDGGGLTDLAMIPFQSRRFRLHRASLADAVWLQQTLDRESRRLGTRVEPGPGGTLVVRSGSSKLGAKGGT